MTPLLAIENLSISFSEKKVLKGLSLSLNKGECVGLVGESGSGKSMTAQAILKLLDSKASVSGKIFFQGEDLLLKNEPQMQKIRGKQIGMVFQDSLTGLNPTMKVGKQVMETIRCHEKIHRSFAREFVLALFQQLGIADAENRFNAYPFELSGGMRQRIMIGLAMACRPQLLIADEATTAVDMTIQSHILYLLRSFIQTYQMGLLLITHEMGIVAGMCDYVIVLREGEVIEHGSVDKIFYSPKHSYTQRLLETAGAFACRKPL